LETNNIFQRNLAVALGIYWGLNVRNLIQIHLDLTFYCTMSRGLVFYRTHCRYVS